MGRIPNPRIPKKPELPPLETVYQRVTPAMSDRQRIDALLDDLARCRRALRHIFEHESEVLGKEVDDVIFECWIEAAAETPGGPA